MSTRNHFVKSANPINHKLMQLRKMQREIMMRVSVFHPEEEDMLEASKVMDKIMALAKIRCLNARHVVITVTLNAPGYCLAIT